MIVYPGCYPGLQLANTFGVTGADYARSDILTLIADDVMLPAACRPPPVRGQD